jgi:hypothetical protein
LTFVRIPLHMASYTLGMTYRNFPLLHLTGCRLTAAKEDGATIEIGGQKVALGIPAAKQRAAATQNVNAFADIPLQRGATADEAAAGMLLYVPASMPVP